MKLRNRIPLLFLSMVLILTTCIVCFLAVYLSTVTIPDIIQQTKKMVRNDFDVVKQVEMLTQYPDRLRHRLSQIAYQENMQLHYHSVDEDVSMHVGKAIPEQKVEQVFPVVVDGQTQGHLTVMRKLDLTEYGLLKLITHTALFFIGALLVLFFFLSLYFYHLITRPIQGLNQRLHRVRVNRPPLPLQYHRKDELGSLYQHVYQMERRLYQAHEEQIHMIAAIAHDLKTPLTSMQGFLELMQSGARMIPEKQAQYVQLIQTKTADIKQLVDIFSSYTKNEYALLDMNMTLLPVEEVFQSVAEEYEAELSGLGHVFRYHHLFTSDDQIEVNVDSFRRIMANLVSNAIRYAGVEEITLVFTGYTEQGMASFVLEDNGQGVEESQLPKLFTRFHTMDVARQRAQGGTGLGLSICRSIVERHGGLIHASPSRFGGLAISFTLPLLSD